MLTKMRNILRTTWRQSHNSPIAGFSKLRGAEFARSSWAKSIESYATVPNVFKDFFDPFLAQKRAFPYVVLTPSHERFIDKTSEKLICNFGHEIYILERNGNTFEAKCYPIDRISYVEFRTALLASSIKLCGLTSQGAHTSSTLNFNSVTDYLFTPILNTIRHAETHSTRGSENSKSEQFACLVKVNFKFMNYARHSLTGKEKVIGYVLQPEIRAKLLTFLGKTIYKTISPTHMMILTDRELIVIREEVPRRTEDRYGGIWDYIPLSKIDSLSLNEKDSGHSILTIQLSGPTQLELLFQESARGEVDQLLNQFGKLH